MPIHDWTRVSAGTFHDFHMAWIAELRKALNDGLLPDGFYAMSEQVGGDANVDVLTLERVSPPTSGAGGGATSVLDAPPQVEVVAVGSEAEQYAALRRRLVIRHASGDRVVALLEIISPDNKDRQLSVQQFVDKAWSALAHGHHLLMIDLFPPGPADPQGMHAEIWAGYDPQPYVAPPRRPLTVASYTASVPKKVYAQPLAVGEALPDMPLFLDPSWYVSVPLEATYQEAFRGGPEPWRSMLERA
jgi:hypothetical protein